VDGDEDEEHQWLASVRGEGHYLCQLLELDNYTAKDLLRAAEKHASQSDRMSV
jgi:hypothetical protein